MPGLVLDATDATFTQVLEISNTVPVIVDLWAEWCGPCKQLSPVLDKLVGEYAGRLLLVKVDVDANPQLTQAFQAQSIPAVAAVIAEDGLDRPEAQAFPKPLTDDVVQAADVVVTMGCGDACPIYPGKRYLDWDLEDPAGQGVAAVRPIRDAIEGRIRGLLAELDVTPTTPVTAAPA